jgi:hypothetical protein
MAPSSGAVVLFHSVSGIPHLFPRALKRPARKPSRPPHIRGDKIILPDTSRNESPAVSAALDMIAGEAALGIKTLGLALGYV